MCRRDLNNTFQQTQPEEKVTLLCSGEKGSRDSAPDINVKQLPPPIPHANTHWKKPLLGYWGTVKTELPNRSNSYINRFTWSRWDHLLKGWQKLPCFVHFKSDRSQRLWGIRRKHHRTLDERWNFYQGNTVLLAWNFQYPKQAKALHGRHHSQNPELLTFQVKYERRASFLLSPKHANRCRQASTL